MINITKTKFINVFQEYANNIMSLDKVNVLIQEFYGQVTDLIGYSQSRHSIPVGRRSEPEEDPGRRAWDPHLW